MKKERIRTMTGDCGNAECIPQSEGKCTIVVNLGPMKRVRINGVNRYDAGCICSKLWEWIRKDEQRVIGQIECVKKQMRGE